MNIRKSGVGLVYTVWAVFNGRMSIQLMQHNVVYAEL